MRAKMRAALRGLGVGLCVVAMSGSAWAQRGGGRGRSFERPETPTTFDSEELGIHFSVPPGLELYTVEAPGRFSKQLTQGRFLYVTNSQMRNASVSAKYSAGMSEADVEGYKQILDANPPQAKLPGFKKRRVRFISIGKAADKRALDFVYDATMDNLPATFRQVVFVHNGKGFTFTCTSLQAEFGAADTVMCDPLISHLEFR